MGFKVGDLVTVTEPSNAMVGFAPGDTCRITNEYSTDGDYEFENIKSGVVGFGSDANIKAFIEDIKEGEIVAVKKKTAVSKKILTAHEIIGQDENKKLLKLAIDNDYPVLLVGETGTGKTTLIREQAIAQKANWVRFNLTGETTVDEFVGKYELEGGATIWRDGILLQAMKEGKWLIVDEINVALPEILFVLHSLLDDDKFVVVSSHAGEVVRPHKDFRFFATMNPSDEYAGTKELNKAFQSRFQMVLHLSYPDKEIETKIVQDKAGIKSSDAAKMADVAMALRKAKQEEKIFYTCSTRDLIQWGKLVAAGLDPGQAFTVTVLNKSNGDKEAIIPLYELVMGKHLALEQTVGKELSIDYFAKEFDRLQKAHKEFDAKRADLRKEIVEELMTSLATKEAPVSPADKAVEGVF